MKTLLVAISLKQGLIFNIGKILSESKRLVAIPLKQGLIFNK